MAHTIAKNGVTARNIETAKNSSQIRGDSLNFLKINNSKNNDLVIVRTSFLKENDGEDVSNKSASLKRALLTSMLKSNGTNAGNINIQNYSVI